MTECIFCKIINGEIPCSIIYENDKILAFNDINPVAPVHILIIPKQHIESAQNISVDNADITAEIFLAASKIAKDKGIDKTGYRIVTNIGVDGGQTVQHLHYHLLGGRSLQWPPG